MVFSPFRAFGGGCFYGGAALVSCLRFFVMLHWRDASATRKRLVYGLYVDGQAHLLAVGSDGS